MPWPRLHTSPPSLVDLTPLLRNVCNHVSRAPKATNHASSLLCYFVSRMNMGYASTRTSSRERPICEQSNSTFYTRLSHEHVGCVTRSAQTYACGRLYGIPNTKPISNKLKCFRASTSDPQQSGKTLPVDHHQVKSRIRQDDALRLIATAEERYGNTPLHRSVSLGFVEMTRMILEAGAHVDELNNMGDAPIHCCWRFWRCDASKYFLWKKDPFLMVTPKQRKDYELMVRCVSQNTQY